MELLSRLTEMSKTERRLYDAQVFYRLSNPITDPAIKSGWKTKLERFVFGCLLSTTVLTPIYITLYHDYSCLG